MESTDEPVSQAPLVTNDIRRLLASRHARGMTPRAIAALLSGWRGYFDYLIRHHDAKVNPCDGVRAPKAARKLPNTLSIEEAISLSAGSEESATMPHAVRDRAAIELLYGCGLRVTELISLNITSIDLTAAEVRVTGKGNKTRIVPVGEHAIAAVKMWLTQRATLQIHDHDALFVGKNGRRLSAPVLRNHLKKLAAVLGIKKNVHPHMLRHSFASHVLQSSQNLRAVQEMMGHASIASTQVYTHLDFQHLSKIYDATHPRAKKVGDKK
jgi:integrase/recombinase XerC